ncbi:hypothetical protein D9757_002370 [Collybiopsis confluens]|uniref:Calcineurin-like phosphoesterase domain-containing protein n=1 Tax=Collybiopsis confluens TaxID=2823264 RepID=A0A8H5HY97_9AGAR|nr:hypothetical protein D9757_002370 [Collybiopsis confluens]
MFWSRQILAGSLLGTCALFFYLFFSGLNRPFQPFSLQPPLLSYGFPDFSHFLSLETLSPDKFPLDNIHRRVILVGDIHGMFKQLHHLLTTVSYDPSSDVLISVGDIVAKGPYSGSMGVLDFMSSHNITAVRGNHDQMVIEWRAWLDWIHSLHGGSRWLSAVRERWKEAQRHGVDDVDKWVAKQTKLDKKYWKFWKKLPNGWKLFGDHFSIAENMTHEQYEYMLQRPLMLHVPHAHTFIVHAGILASDPNYNPGHKRQPLAHVPKLPKGDESVIGERDRINALRELQELAILSDVPQNTIPWNTLNMRRLLDSEVTRTKEGTPWKKLYNRDMRRCAGFSATDSSFLPCYPSTVVYGHIASQGLDIDRWSIGLDSGCVNNHRMSALVLGGKLAAKFPAFAENEVSRDTNIDGGSSIKFGDSGHGKIYSVSCDQFKKAAGIAGGLYLAHGYLHARLEEVKERIESERLARDILQRRYEQTQEDVGYTVMALLSNLGEQILEEMDVEAIIGELQTMSNKNSAGSDSLSASVSSSASESSTLSTSGLRGWVEATAETQTQAGYSSSEDTSSVMSGSFITNLSTASESEPSSSSASVASLPSNSSSGPISSTSRTKAQLWNSVKLLTFTRTVTTIYSITLLSLLTLAQLTILARIKYVHAIKHMSVEEDQEAELQSEMSMPNMLLTALKVRFGFPQQPLFKTLFPSAHNLLFAGDDEDDEGFGFEPSSLDVPFETLSADYLTLSYFLLHIGWKDLSTRVQPAVEEVLEGVSLKTRLSKTDVHRVLKDIMQRISLDGSFDSFLLPRSEEMVGNVLVLGGRDDHDPSSSLDELLKESRAIFSSRVFSDLLDSCVNWAVDSLMDSLEAEGRIFAPGDETEPPRVRLASILPPLASWSRNCLLALPSELADGLLAKNETRTFSAWIWAKFESEV